MLPPASSRLQGFVVLVPILFLLTLLGGALNSAIPGPEYEVPRFLVASYTFHAATLIVVQLLLWRWGVGWGELFGLGREKVGRTLFLGVVTAIVILPVAWLLSYASAELMRLLFLEPESQQVVNTLTADQTVWALASMGLVAVVIAPAAEEVLFRGLLYPALKRGLGLVPAVLLSSILFGAIHLNLATFVPLTLLGVVLVLIYEATGDLLAPIVAHSLFNLANLLFLLAI